MNVLSKIRPVLIVLFWCIATIGKAQEGGPPMLTDDARVTEWKEWEINTSVNTSVTNHLLLSLPHVDVNYGLLRKLQLKAEAPLLLQFKDHKTQSRVGEVIVGVKYRFLDEEKNFISAATFPQVYLHGSKGYLLPVFIEKTIGRF